MALGPALIPVARASDLEAQAQRASDEKQNSPMIQGLVCARDQTVGGHA